MQAPILSFSTLGCRVNQAETQGFMEALGTVCGVVPFGEPADLTIINTCTVTREAHQQSLQQIRRAFRANPGAWILVTGCAVDLAPAQLAALPGVVRIVPSRDKEALVEVACKLLGQQATPAVAAPGTYGHTRAFLKLSDGCDNRCTFCVIPRTRGRQRSIARRELVARAVMLAEAGHRELVLTGTNLGSWGQDTGEGDLGSLLQALLAEVPDVPRFRLGSIEPMGFPPALVEALARPRVCPQLHLCLQSGSDAVLSRMRRRYNVAGYRRLVARLREARPDLALSTDVLVGFPGETAADFEATLAACEEFGFVSLHVFPFSARPGTEAANLPDPVDARTLAERMERILDLGRRLAGNSRDRWLGHEVEVLTERPSDGRITGLTPHGMRVVLDTAGGISGNELHRVLIVDQEEARLVGRLLARAPAWSAAGGL